MPDKETLKAIGYTLVLCVLAVFAFEVVLIAEVVGTEFAVTFVLLYYKQAWFELIERWIRFKAELNQQLLLLSELLVFQPRSYGVSATASCVFILFTGSTVFACAVWLPALLLSQGQFLV